MSVNSMTTSDHRYNSDGWLPLVFLLELKMHHLIIHIQKSQGWKGGESPETRRSHDVVSSTLTLSSEDLLLGSESHELCGSKFISETV